MDNFLTEKQALELLPIGRTLLSQERANGKITFYKFGKSVYFKLEDIERYLSAHRKGPRKR